MTNKERISARIKRDKERKAAKRNKKLEKYADYSKVFTTKHYYCSLAKCQAGVKWKGTVQVYSIDAVSYIKETIDYIIKNRRTRDLKDIDIIKICERGKTRHVVAIKIEDRITQRVVCDYSLSPMVKDQLIYTNGASLPNKGVEFTRDNIHKDLVTMKRDFGNNFYVCTMDFSKYFDNIPHKTCRRVLEKLYGDCEIVDMIMHIVKSYQKKDAKKNIKNKTKLKNRLNEIENLESVGICLGSQISQILALLVPNEFDHYIKDVMGVKCYHRYMDDSVIIHQDKEFIKKVIDGAKKILNNLGITVNDKKTKICKITKGFKFLQIKYRINSKMKIVRTLSREGIVRARKKLISFRKKVDNGEMTRDQVVDFVMSRLSCMKYAKARRSRKEFLKLFYKLFGNNNLKLKKSLKRRTISYELLQAA